MANQFVKLQTSQPDALPSARAANGCCSSGPAEARPVSPVAAWLVFCAFWSFTGWVLSLAHALNEVGYAVAALVGIVGAAIWIRKTRRRLIEFPCFPKLRRRFRRLCPLTFLTLAVMASLGGALYGPANYDALSYRIPRVLHWLAEGRWHWIHTGFHALNVNATGFEWVSAPLILLARSARLLFLINAISFCLMPGLLFSCFTLLGIKRRVAYAWMWLLPSGYCFLLQAGSVANDLFVTLLGLAAVTYALRAQKSGLPDELWLSILAAALFTGAKATALPLVLVWLVAAAPGWRLLKERIATTMAVGVLALTVSFLPTAALNWYHCGDWTGAKAQHFNLTGADTAARWFGNAGMTVVNNFTPPVAPFANHWNTKVAPKLVPVGLREKVANSFDARGGVFAIGEMQIEEAAGLGFGISVLLAVSALAACMVGARQRPRAATSTVRAMQWAIFAATLVAVLAVMKMAFAKSTPRLLAPYYIFLAMPCLLLPGNAHLVRGRWWSVAVVANWLLAAFLLVINPARPLFPARATLNFAARQGTSAKLLSRLDQVYSVYAQRPNGFAPVLRALPANEKVVGLVRSDDPEASLWWPLGARRIVHVCPEDNAEAIRSRGIRYVLLNREKSGGILQEPLESWLQRMNAKVAKEIPLKLRAAEPEANWLLVELH